ncbi:hypothetical protein [Brevibacterium litoralis]|uniref:hypothetical protein n=1 Tax=Brevibacterium litoralis TaxID=3138935 RepID=UPI0032ECED1C
MVAAIESPADDMLTALGTVQQATFDPAPEVDTTRARDLVARAGWYVDPASPELAHLARALEAIDDAGLEITDETWSAYLFGISGIARAEVDGVPADREAALRHALLGTILLEPVLLALRRLAHQHASGRRYGAIPPGGFPPGGPAQR